MDISSENSFDCIASLGNVLFARFNWINVQNKHFFKRLKKEKKKEKKKKEKRNDHARKIVSEKL